MRVKFIFPFFLALSLIVPPLVALELGREEAEKIGAEIFHNECGLKLDKLVWWNVGEEFASLGIGHFIWYPEEKQGPFEELFPSLLEFFKSQNVPLPDWLTSLKHCPWKSAEEFSDPKQEQKKKELCALFIQTIPLQVTFMANRFDRALERILSSIDEKKKSIILGHIEKLQSCWRGKCALIDYLNFKGDGTYVTERYKGQGWGLAQVLEEMPSKASDPVLSFATAAKKVLIRRVHNSPAKAQEERWLKGWCARIDRYVN